MTAPEWRDCADPDELAAAVAAGVEVLAMGRAGDFPTANQTADQFAGSLRAGITYQLPALWSWRPEPPAPDEVVAPDDDRTTRRRRPTRRARQRGPRPGGGCDGTSNGPTRKEAAMNETKTEWRDCADPDELAAAVAAGVEVLRMRGGGWVPSALTHRDDFAWFLTHGTRYQLPTAVQCECTAKRVPDVPPAVDLRERTLAQVATGSAAWSAVRRHLTQFEPITSAADMDALASEIADAVLAVLPAPPPVPPWPGAVLSGLCDEDGVPTWLAQAGNVQGESVRTCADFPWFVCGSDNASDRTWVEVRAPRAVPEPETERVPWWESVGRVVRDATGREAQILRADVGDGAGPSVYAYHDQEPGAALRRLYAPVNGFGTVEVLKDGDR